VLICPVVAVVDDYRKMIERKIKKKKKKKRERERERESFFRNKILGYPTRALIS
jgi:hypothetical protein